MSTMNNKIFFITGPQGGGKTTFVKALAGLLKESGFSTGGFIAEGYWDNNLRSGFDIVELGGLNKELLCNTIAGKGDEKFHRFFFKQKGLQFGNQILEKTAGKNLIVIIDEVGALELEGRGWANIIEKLLQNPPATMIWTIRENIAEIITARFNIIPDALWNINFTTPENVFKVILKMIKQ
jgi:nucleoside-triphosphatase